MRLPFDRLLMYYVAVGFDDEEIRHLAQMDNLVVPDVAELAHLRCALADRPQPFRWQDPDDRRVNGWLKERGIHKLVRGDRSAREAVALLRHQQGRHPAEILLLGGNSAAVVSRFHQEHDLVDVSPAGVEEFRLLVWDTASMGLDGVSIFLDRLGKLGDVFRDALNGPEHALNTANVFVKRLQQILVTSTLPGAGSPAGRGFVSPPMTFPTSRRKVAAPSAT